MLEYLVLFLAASLTPTRGDDEGFYITPNDTTQCANDLIKWCKGMKYPQGGGVSMISVNINEPNGYLRILCISDPDGTNCTKNGMPWFACSKNNTFSYKGNQLSEGSDEGTDQDTCNTASRAFNDLMVQSLSYDNETVKNEVAKGLESFFKEMARLQEQIKAMNEKIMSMFGNNFPFWPGDSAYDSSYDTSNEEESTAVQNDREQE